MKNIFGKKGHGPDYFLIAVVFLLTIFGLAMLSSASSDLGKSKFNDSYYFIRHQIYFGLSLGIAGFLIAMKLNYQAYKKIAFVLLIIGIIFLALVFTKFGLNVRNTSRWARLGPLSFQPAELMKIIYIVYLAAWLSNSRMKREKNITEGLLPFGLFSGFIAALLLLQPATSTVVILMGAGLVVYFLSGASWKYPLIIMGAGALILALVIYATPYRRARVLGFLNKNSDSQGINYHLDQALIAIGAGRVWGVGYGQSTSKLNYLPTPMDDSIFAVTGEELGFVGSAGLIALFAMLTFRLFWLAKETRDKFGRLLLIGFGTIIAFQSIVNISAISGVLPLTGVPLPFVSYGGTALAIFLTMSGIAVNISKYT